MKALKFSLFSLAVISILCSSSCDTTEEVVNGTIESPKQLDIKQINQGVLTGAREEPVGFEKGYVIQSEEEWEELRGNMNAINNAQGKISINFEKLTVLAYFDKVRPNGGYSIEIVEAIESDDEIKAMIKSIAPTGMATDIMTQPFHIVKIPKTDKPVKFLPVTE
ncbi:MAG: protease complex subunit PrcB family protein [Crocinitomicaceae bacterium]|nr:protease complex subunit PrcB family protein [Crocinitomicaceae bacterium]